MSVGEKFAKLGDKRRANAIDALANVRVRNR